MNLVATVSSGIMLIALSLDGSSAAWSQQKLGPPVKVEGAASARLSQHDLKVFRALSLGNKAPVGSKDVAAVQSDAKTYCALHLEFDSAQSCESFQFPAAHLISRFERFADVFVEADQSVLEDLQLTNGLVWMELDLIGIVPPPPRPIISDEKSRDLPLEIVRGGYRDLTGKGVIIAVIDTGIDFRHPDFITYDRQGVPTSRIMYFWDTFSDAYGNGIGQPAPVTYPNGAPIGTVFSRDELTRELRQPRPSIHNWDSNGHGTACAGIAAGNGNSVSGNKHAGVAPGADIIAVRIGQGVGLPNAYLIGAICDWLAEVNGAGEPLVLSCSWGGQYGGRDGQLILERQLSARFAPDVHGKVACFAAGNEGALDIHAPVVVGTQSDPGVLQFFADGPCLVEFYVPESSFDGLFVGQVDDTELQSVDAHVNPFTNQAVVSVVVQAPGRGGVYIYNDQGAPLDADAYIAGAGAGFHPSFSSREKQLGAPSCAENVITVGSFDWNDQFSQFGQTVYLRSVIDNAPIKVGQASLYSSPGPLRIGSVAKPDIVAPGQWYTAAAPLNVDTTRDSSGYYQTFNGTSAATPYVAGIVALMFQADPDLTVGEIRDALKTCATVDPITDAVPNPKWGNGRLDIQAVGKLLGGAD